MPPSYRKMDMQDIGFYLHMEECERNIRAKVEEEFYITEEEKELIEQYRRVDDVTKKAILSIYGIK